LALAAVALATAHRGRGGAPVRGGELTDAVRELAGTFAHGNRPQGRLQFRGLPNDLARQIKAGAPADVFFSADEAQMDGLQTAGRGARAGAREPSSRTCWWW
jgi:molybdate transport system substrate-binding protein